ncbi:MAG: hypothetical protein KY459_06225 [Acidobacteria bacterium]|nr:hypothetical protein [Acidobacteriota bacterium]
MRVQARIIASVLLFGVSCSDEKPLRGWKNSDVEVINEGTASGSASHVVAPGESFEPMTSTDVDTTTVTDIVGTETLEEGEFVDEGTLASTLELDEEGQPVSGNPPETRPRRAAPPQPSPGPSPAEPARETRRSTEPEPVERPDPTDATREEPEEPETEPEEEPPTEESEEPPSEEPDENLSDEADSVEESAASSENDRRY